MTCFHMKMRFESGSPEEFWKPVQYKVFALHVAYFKITEISYVIIVKIVHEKLCFLCLLG